MFFYDELYQKNCKWTAENRIHNINEFMNPVIPIERTSEKGDEISIIFCV